VYLTMMEQGSDRNPYQAPRSDIAGNESDQLSGSGAQQAPRITRLGALLLDGLFQAVILVPLQYVLGAEKDVPLVASFVAPKTLLWQLGNFVIFATLNGYLLVKNGQTIGKRLTGIRIANFGDGGTPPLAKILVLRYLPMQVLPLLPFWGVFLALAGDLMIFRPDQRCLHDHIAGTVVLKA
jgi:uncharacterized RDD family membrane protein YckC